MLLLRERPELKILIIEKAAAFSRRVDRKSTRLNSSHSQISYAVFCLKKKKEHPFGLPSSLHPATVPSGPLLSNSWITATILPLSYRNHTVDNLASQPMHTPLHLYATS